MIIKDIDSPLYKYLLFYRFDIRNRFLTNKQKLYQRIKNNILCIYLFLSIVRYGIYLIVCKNGKIPIYYLDIIQYFGGITEYFYLNSFFFSILCLRILYIFNHSNSDEYEWLNIIRALCGLKSIYSFKFHDKNDIQLFVNKMKKLKLFNYLSVYFYLLITVLMIMTVSIFFLNTPDLIVYHILSAILYFSFNFSIITVISYSFLYFFIVCYYCKMRFKSFNNYLKSLLNGKSNSFLELKTVDKLIEDHNSICLDTNLCNKFWQKYYFALTYTLIPSNLLALQLLFENLDLIPFIITLSTSLETMGSFLMFTTITASINSEALESYKALNKLFSLMSYSTNVGRKVKVTEYLSNF